MNYTDEECDVIVADGLEGLNYKQKRAFLCAVDEKRGEHKKSDKVWI